jgi:hypothetical protein
MQSSLMDQLQEHEFTLLLANVPLDDVRAHFYSCACLALGVWLLAYPSTFSFPFVFSTFSYNILYSFWYITSYIPYLSHDVIMVVLFMIWVSICYIAHVIMNTLQPMICFEILL